MARRKAPPVVGYSGAPVSGTLTAAGQSVALAAGAAENVSLSVWGTFSGTLVPEATLDDTHWFGVPALAVGSPTSPSGTIAAAGLWQVRAGGFSQVRLRAGADFSGSAAVLLALGSVGGGGGGGGAATVADGADVAQGSTTDAAVTTDVAGTLSGKLRGLVKILGAVWDAANGLLLVGLNRVGGTAVVTGGVAGTLAVGGVKAAGQAAAGVNPVLGGMSDGTNLQQALAAIALGDGVNGNNQLPVVLYGYNGSAYDRLQADAARNLKVARQATPSGGATQARLRNLAGTPTAVKTSAGTLYGLHVLNTTGAAAYVQLFDVATGSVTPGTMQPITQFLAPANSDTMMPLPAVGLAFATAITAISTTASEGGTGSATGVMAYAAYA